MIFCIADQALSSCKSISKRSPAACGVIVFVKTLRNNFVDQGFQLFIIYLLNIRKIGSGLSVKYLQGYVCVYQLKGQCRTVACGKTALKGLIDVLSIESVGIISISKVLQRIGRTCCVNSASNYGNKLCECNHLTVNSAYAIGVITKTQFSHHLGKRISSCITFSRSNKICQSQIVERLSKLCHVIAVEVGLHSGYQSFLLSSIGYAVSSDYAEHNYVLRSLCKIKLYVKVQACIEEYRAIFFTQRVFKAQLINRYDISRELQYVSYRLFLCSRARKHYIQGAVLRLAIGDANVDIIAILNTVKRDSPGSNR